MKFTREWLKTHLDTAATLDAICRTATALGLEVESVDDRAAALAPFRVVEILSAAPHPDADRLKVCRVLTADHGEVQVVCGASNARAGLKAVLAPPGSTVPGKGGITLKKSTIRGQESFGMMVSEEELGLPTTIDGIIEAPPTAAVGDSFASIAGLDDAVIDINLTPNRADCASVRGIARDLAAAGLGTLKPLAQADAVDGTFACPVTVTTTTPACPVFMTRLVRGVRNGPSPEWMQQRLRSIGLKPISALVDITNFMTFDLGRPMHVFDADRITGNLVIRAAKTGETLEALNDKTYTLQDGMTVIADEGGVINLGGIMGGRSTGCSDKTTNVLIECAWFDPLSTARTGRALGITSDARYRFERGVDPAFLPTAMAIITRLILDMCGGEASTVQVAGTPDHYQPSRVAYTPSTVAALGGVDVPAGEQARILEALGCVIANRNTEAWEVTIPSWRSDISGPADLVEEIVRVNGYDRIPTMALPPVPETGAGTTEFHTPLSGRSACVRVALAGRGLKETVTWSFLAPDRAALFGPVAPALTLTNPISADLAVMRPSLLPNMIDAVRRNADFGRNDTALFEIGPVFSHADKKGVEQSVLACAVRAQRARVKTWESAERSVDAIDAKADALAALEACGVNIASLTINRTAPDWYHPGRSGAILMGRVPVAYFGELHPLLAQTLDVPFAVVACEIVLESLPAPRKKTGSARPLLVRSPFPAVERDFAVLVPADDPVGPLLTLVRKADPALIRSVTLFDVYQGTGVPEGQKSIAFRVRLQANDRTLDEETIQTVSRSLLELAAREARAVIRSA